MAYIGKQPATVALTSADLEDNIVTSSKLNNDIISGQTALAEAPADADELLISDAGTLKRMDYSHIKASSDFVKLSGGTMSSANTLTFDSLDTSTYKAFRFILTDVVSLGTYTGLKLKLRYDDSGSQATRTDSKYMNAMQGYRNSAQNARTLGTAVDQTQINLNNDLTQYGRTDAQTFDVTLYDLGQSNSGTTLQIFNGGVEDTTGTNVIYYVHGWGFYQTANANNGFTIFTANSANFTGNYQLYGIK